MKERIMLWLAWRVPKDLAYWCAVRVMSHATTGNYAYQLVHGLLAVDALKRWDEQ